MAKFHWIIIVISGLAFGASFSLNKMLLVDFGPLTIAALRIGIGALGCWAWLGMSRPARISPLGELGKLTVLGIFQFAAPFAILPIAQLHITSSVAGIANALTPVATVILSLILLTGERTPPSKILGVGFGVLGAVALVWGGETTGGSDPAYVLLALCAPLSYAIALNLGRKPAALEPVVLITWALSFGFMAIAPIAVLKEGVPSLPDLEALRNLVVSGLALTAIPFAVLYALMRKVGAVNVSLVTFIAPLSALFIGILGFQEPVGAAHLLGTACIMAGLLTVDGRLPRLLARRFALRAASSS